MFGTLSLRHTAESTKIFADLVTNNPNDKSSWFGLAASLQEEKIYDIAIYAWGVSSLLDMDNPYPYFHAAECLLSMKNIKGAFLALNEAKKRSVENDEILQKINILKKIWDSNE